MLLAEAEKWKNNAFFLLLVGSRFSTRTGDRGHSSLVWPCNCCWAGGGCCFVAAPALFWGFVMTFRLTLAIVVVAAAAAPLFLLLLLLLSCRRRCDFLLPCILQRLQRYELANNVAAHVRGLVDPYCSHVKQEVRLVAPCLSLCLSLRCHAPVHECRRREMMALLLVESLRSTKGVSEIRCARCPPAPLPPAHTCPEHSYDIRTAPRFWRRVGDSITRSRSKWTDGRIERRPWRRVRRIGWMALMTIKAQTRRRQKKEAHEPDRKKGRVG